MAETKFWDASEVVIPADYEWVSRGDTYLTRKIKSLCNGRNQIFFTRMTKTRRFSRAMGIYAPKDIVAETKRLRTETEEKRAAQRAKSAVYRSKQEERYRTEFAERVRELYPSMPEGDEEIIAQRACEVGSERVGRTRQIDFDEKVRLAVIAHARHNYTQYEDYLEGVVVEEDYADVRRGVRSEVEKILRKWETPGP